LHRAAWSADLVPLRQDLRQPVEMFVDPPLDRRIDSGIRRQTGDIVVQFLGAGSEDRIALAEPLQHPGLFPVTQPNLIVWRDRDRTIAQPCVDLGNLLLDARNWRVAARSCGSGSGRSWIAGGMDMPPSGIGRESQHLGALSRVHRVRLAIIVETGPMSSRVCYSVGPDPVAFRSWGSVIQRRRRKIRRKRMHRPKGRRSLLNCG
jgi:hypothetical protein